MMYKNKIGEQPEAMYYSDIRMVRLDGAVQLYL